MALEINILAPFSFSLAACKDHLSVKWGEDERELVLRTNMDWAEDAPIDSGKWCDVWRAEVCGTLNVSAFGFHLMFFNGKWPAGNIVTKGS